MPRVFLVESGAILVAASITASDSLVVGATEVSKPLLALTAATDAVPVPVSDVLGSGSPLFLMSRRVDSVGVAIVDGHFDPVLITASDTIAIGQPLVEDEFNRNESPLSTNWANAAGLAGGLNDNTVFVRGSAGSALGSDNFATDRLALDYAVQSGENGGVVSGGVWNYNGSFPSGHRRTAESYGSDHFSEIVLTDVTNIFDVSARVRCQAAARSYYAGGIDPNDGGNTLYRIWKLLNGVWSQLAVHASQLGQVGDVVRLTPTGSSLALSVNGLSILTTTDPDLTGGTPGFGGAAPGTPPISMLDGWLGGGIVAAGITGSVWTPSLPPQQVSEIVLVSAGGIAGPVVRGSETAIQGYWLRTGGDTPLAWTLQKLISSGPTFSQIAAGTWVTPVTDNSVIRIEIVDGGATASSPSTLGIQPTLPLVFLNTAYVAPTGATFTPLTTAAYQTALNTAVGGDKIVLAAGTSYGPVNLPNRASGGVVTIESSLRSEFVEGVRVVPGQSGSMPKIVSTNTDPAISCAAGAHGFRFVAVEIATTWATTNFTNFNLILLEAPGFNATLADCPTNIVFDRCYIHGTPTGNCRRGILMNGIAMAAVECYISDFHEIGADTQAICVTNGPGPFKIVNNYLEAAGENALFGGADPEIPNLVPSDIEFRNNYCYKQMAWDADNPFGDYAGIRWTIKNCFELKNAQRVLVDGNTFDRKWGADGGQLHAIALTVRNQDGTAPWSVVQDVTFTNNLITHVGGGVSILGTDNNFPSQTTSRLLIRNNVFDIDGPTWGGRGNWFILSGGVDITIDHNTAFHGNGSAGNNNAAIIFTTVNGNLPIAARDKTTRLIFADNICAYGNFGFFGDLGAGSDNAAFTAYAPGLVFRRNAIVGGVATNLPADNFYPADLTAVGFLNLANFPDVRLAPTSQFVGDALDGKDIGVDYALTQATAVLAVYNDRQAGVVTSGSLVDASAPPASGKPGIFALGDNVLITAWRGSEAPLLERSLAIVSLLATPKVATDTIVSRVTVAPASLDIKTFVNVAAADSLRSGLAEAGLVTIAFAPVNVSVFASDSLPVELEPSRLATDSIGPRLTESASIVATSFFVAASGETFAPQFAESGVRLTVSNSTPQVTEAPTPVVVDQVRELSVADFGAQGDALAVGNLIEDSDAFPFVPGPNPGLDTIRVVWPERSAIFVQPLVVESVRLTMTETAVQAVSIASSDSFLVVMTEAAALTINTLVVAADTLAAQSVDDPLLQIQFFSADSVATSTSEATLALQRTLLAPADTLTAGLAESGQFPIQRLQPSLDSLAAGLTELSMVVVLGQGSFFASSDAQDINATEVGFVLASVLVVASDSLAVQGADVSAFLAATSIASSDTLTVGETETSALLVNALVTSADSVSTGTSETTSLTILETGQFRAVTETEVLGLTEIGRPLVIVASSEIMAVALTEQQGASITEPGAELMPLNANDLAALIERAMNNVEPAGVRVLEDGEVLIVGGLIELTAVDLITGTIDDSTDPDLNEIDRGDGNKFRVGGRMPAGELVASPTSSRVRTWWELPYAR